MKAKHAKGPWKIKKDYDNLLKANLEKDGIHSTIQSDDGWNIARIWSSAPNADANARLIAAAPDLLAACKWLEAAMDKRSDIWCAIREISGCSEWVEGMRAAIAKANEA